MLRAVFKGSPILHFPFHSHQLLVHMSLPIGDVLSLEHIIGYTGRFPSTLRLHPAFETGVAYSLGPTVVLGDVTDPHEQIFLRKHESPVSALDVSPSGALLVSGQLHEPAVRPLSSTSTVFVHPRLYGSCLNFQRLLLSFFDLFRLPAQRLHLSFYGTRLLAGH